MADSARPVAPARQEGLERRLVARGDQLGPALLLALGVEQVVVEGRGRQRRALLLRGALGQQLVDRAQRVGGRLVAGALDQGAQLQQLEEAGHRAADVEVGVEPRLAERPAGAPGLLEDVVLDHPVGGVQALGRARTAPRAARSRRRRARRAPPRRRARRRRAPRPSRRAGTAPASCGRASSPCRAGAAGGPGGPRLRLPASSARRGRRSGPRPARPRPGARRRRRGRTRRPSARRRGSPGRRRRPARPARPRARPPPRRPRPGSG